MIALEELNILKTERNFWGGGDLTINIPTNDVGALVSKVKPVVDLQTALRSFQKNGYSTGHYQTGKGQIEVRMYGIGDKTLVVFKDVNDAGYEAMLRIADVLGLNLQN